MYKYAIIPAWVRKREKQFAALANPTKQQESQNTPDDGNIFEDWAVDASVRQQTRHVSVLNDRLKRAVFTFDYSHIAAVLDGLDERCQKLWIELFKYAAACSLIQQANNTSHSYHILKKFIFESKFWDPKTRTDPVTVMMERYLPILKVSRFI